MNNLAWVFSNGNFISGGSIDFGLIESARNADINWIFSRSNKVAELLRTATCRCGQLSATCTGEPARVSVCHCYDCQKRSGSVCAAQARFPADAVTISGEHKVYEHVGDSGNSASFHFCPTCGSTLWYHARPHHDLFAIPTGAFADRDFPAPQYSVYEVRKHPWVSINGDNIEHYD